MAWSDRLLVLFVLIAVPFCLFVVPLYLLFGGLRTFALRPLQRCFDGIAIHSELMPGDVSFVYHTYRGFLLWVTQDEHRVFASQEDAEKLLGRLLRFNLTWGMLSYGMLFIPFLALSNYWAQKQSLQRQADQLQK